MKFYEICNDTQDLVKSIKKVTYTSLVSVNMAVKFLPLTSLSSRSTDSIVIS